MKSVLDGETDGIQKMFLSESIIMEREDGED